MPLKTGYDLSSKRLSAAYSQIQKRISMPSYFYPKCVEILQLQFLSSGLNNGELLDIGCGNGYLLKSIVTSLPKCRVYGIEFSSRLVKNAKLRLNNSEIIQGSAPYIPFKNETLDIVTITEVIEHLKEPDILLQEVRRVLKSNGIVLITFPNMSAYKPFVFFASKIPMKPIRDVFLPWEHPLKTFQPIDTAYSYEEIIDLINKNRFEIIKIEGAEYIPYITNEIPLWRKIYRKHLQPDVDKIFNKFGLQQKAYRLFIVAKKIAEKPLISDIQEV